MPKKIDPKVNERRVQQMLDHPAEYANPTASVNVIGKHNGVGGETVIRWHLQAQVDSGQRRGVPARSWLRSRNSRPRSAGARRTTTCCDGPRFSSRGIATPETIDRRIHRRLPRSGSCGRVGLPGPVRARLSDRRTDLPGVGRHRSAGPLSHGQWRDGDERGA